MQKFSRKGSMIQVKLTEFEISILTSLIQQIAGLLEGDATAPSEDPFARWQAEFSPIGLDFDDPVIARLFPEALPGDAQATAEFRRLTAGRQRQERLGNAGIVLDDLEANDDGVVEIAAVHLDAWLKTIASVRLSLAVRLGIDSKEDLAQYEALAEDAPTAFVYEIYEWLAYVSESLLELLTVR